MTARYVLHLNARGAVAMRGTRRGIAVLGRFDRAVDAATPPEGADLLFASTPRARWEFVVDSVDEELHVEDMPPLRGADRSRMMARRIAQRFRDRRLATWMPIGSMGGGAGGGVGGRNRGLVRWFGAKATPAAAAGEGGGAGEGSAAPRQQVLLAGLTIDQDLEAWSTLARTRGVRLAGVRSPALLAADVARRLGAGATGLLVTVQPAGIRQTLIVDGRPRFTRLAVVAGGRIDAAAVVPEVTRVMQYLLMSQIVPRDRMRDGGFVGWVVADGVSSPELLPEELVVDNSSAVAVRRLTAATLGATAVLDEGGQPLADDDPAAGLAIWTQPGLYRAGGCDYASTAMRAVDRQATLSRAIIGVGSGALVASLLAYVGVIAVDQLLPSAVQPVLSRADAAEFARLEAERAKANVAGGEMARVVTAERGLREQALAPMPLVQAIGQVLSEAVDVRLNSLSWSRVVAGQGGGSDGSEGVGTAAQGLPGVDSGSSGAAGPSGADGAQAGQSALGVLRVLVRAELPEPLSKAAANARAEVIARVLGSACRCSAALVSPPFDAEPSTGYTTQPVGGGGDRRRFVVELRPEVPAGADALAGRDGARS